jgi:hypothetical protein
MSVDRTQSLLNAIQAPATALAGNGRIEATNPLWSQSRQANALDGRRFVSGGDFVALCADGGAGEPLIAGLRDIWAGKAQTFTHTYSTGEGETKRHFEIVASVMAGADGTGAHRRPRHPAGRHHPRDRRRATRARVLSRRDRR